MSCSCGTECSNSKACKLISARLSGGKVSLEFTPEIVDLFIDHHVEVVSEWYFEPEKYATVSPFSTKPEGQYVDVSSLKINYVKEVLRARKETLEDLAFAEDHIERVTLAGRSREPSYYAIVEAAAYAALRPQLDKAFNLGIEHFFDETNKVLLISTSRMESLYTIVYYPKVEHFCDITRPRAKDWVLDQTTATLKEVLARVRGKFRSDGLGFSTDADNLLSEASIVLERAKETLAGLDF